MDMNFEVVRYGFEERGLRRTGANRFGSNTASGRVLDKVRIVYQGTIPDYYEKWGEKEDRVEYAGSRAKRSRACASTTETPLPPQGPSPSSSPASPSSPGLGTGPPPLEHLAGVLFGVRILSGTLRGESK